MSSVQDRLKIKRESCDTWSTREQLCLASSVLKSGDQNWISVSRSLKPFAEKEALRPPDWFSQKSCAVQYAILLENADTPKRKKRESGETTGESIVRRLRQERIAELGQILAFQRDEYQQLKSEVNLLKSGVVSDEKLQKMWSSIEQEEREQEQKTRAHSAWLAKRQQKLDGASSQTTPVSTSKKISESTTETQDSVESSNSSEDEKKNRNGQAALLTSLLTSPSPTTQTQNTMSTAQVTSPTIASLLGSNTKTQTTQQSPRMSPQLHQIITSTMSTPTNERPSVGAPTLSMLLALPANLSRRNLSTLPTTTAPTSVTDVVTTPTKLSTKPIIQSTPAIQPPIVSETSNIPEADSMVQIIDQIDDVIGKDKIADVIDKDEINEIIGDIEELIKEEITGTPQTTTSTTPVINTISIPIEKPVQLPERTEPRDIDEPLSNSPESEIAIEDIDQSTSNIAEIIGAAIEPAEPKVIVENILENDAPVETKIEELLPVEGTVEEKEAIDESSAMETEETVTINETNETVEEMVKNEKGLINGNEEPEEKTEEAEERITEDENPVKNEVIEELEKEEPKEMPVKSVESDVTDQKLEEQEEKVEESSLVESTKEEVIEAEKESEEIAEVDEKPSVIESTEVKSETPKSKEVEQSTEAVKLEEIISEQSIESSDIQDLKEEVSENKETIEQTENVSECDEKVVKSLSQSEDAQKSNEEVDNTTKEEVDCKIEETRSVVTTPTILAEPDDMPEQKIEDTPILKLEAEDEIEETLVKAEEVIVKDELIEEKLTTTEEMEVAEVPPEESTESKEMNETKKPKEVKLVEEVEEKKEIIEDTVEVSKEVKDTKETTKETKAEKLDKAEKSEKVEKVMKEDLLKKKKDEEILEVKKEESITTTVEETELEEEESSLTKLSAGRAMKTYSKKQNVAVDSEPETESSGEGADYRAWKKAVMLVYNRLATHKYASVFLRPITEDQAPGYHSVIFRPMDLSTIKKNIDNGTIRSTMHFQRDVMLMFQNAIMYNKHDTFVYQMAVSMQEECLQHMQILVEVTGEGPFRRETRTAASSSSETSESSVVKRKRSHITPSPHDTESPRMKKRRKSEND